MKYNKITIIIAGIFIFLVIMILSFIIKKNKKKKRYQKILDNLEVEKNLISSIPVSLELSKMDSMTKNEDLKEKYDKWNNKIDYIKNKLLPNIDNLLIELDTFFEKKDYKNCDKNICKCELEIYKVR